MDLMMKHKETLKMKKEVIMKSKIKGGGGFRKRSNSLQKNSMKVVYILTPMKVKTSASQFMKIVQKLTGRESDVVRIMESRGGMDTWMDLGHDDHDHGDHHHGIVPSSLVVDNDGSSPSSSSEDLADYHGDHHHHNYDGSSESGPFDCNLLFERPFSFQFGQELGNY